MGLIWFTFSGYNSSFGEGQDRNPRTEAEAMLLTGFALSWFSPIAQTHLPRDGAAHRGLGALKTIINQERFHRGSHRKSD